MQVQQPLQLVGLASREQRDDERWATCLASQEQTLWSLRKRALPGMRAREAECSEVQAARTQLVQPVQQG